MRCPNCKKDDLTTTDFYWSKGRRGSWCKNCHRTAMQAVNARNYAKDPQARVRQQVRYHRARRLGMSRLEYEALGEDPGKQCAICGVAPDSPRNGSYSNGKTIGRRNLAMDHSHASGVRRGFLCSNCNNGLGRFDDNPAYLRAAADYLECGVS